MFGMTNAVKAGIITVINAAFPLLAAFGLELSAVQISATNVFINAVLGLWVLLTYQNSHKRMPDDAAVIVTTEGDIQNVRPFFEEADYDEEGNFRPERDSEL